MQKGYTLVELLIIIGIIALLVTFSLSAYAKAQERQNIQQTKEKILTILQEAQKKAYVGDKDCDGALQQIQITFDVSSIRTQALCDGDSGTLVITPLSNVTFTEMPTISFRPLDQGITLPSGSSANIDYQIGVTTYRFTVTKPGSITYLGAI